jgi:hypothetical protein
MRLILPGLLAVAALLAAEDRIPDDTLVGRIDALGRERQPRSAERRIDEIGWARDIRAARELSAKHDRPVFLFTMDGRIAIGRC